MAAEAPLAPRSPDSWESPGARRDDGLLAVPSRRASAFRPPGCGCASAQQVRDRPAASMDASSGHPRPDRRPPIDSVASRTRVCRVEDCRQDAARGRAKAIPASRWRAPGDRGTSLLVSGRGEAAPRPTPTRASGRRRVSIPAFGHGAARADPVAIPASGHGPARGSVSSSRVLVRWKCVIRVAADPRPVSGRSVLHASAGCAPFSRP